MEEGGGRFGFRGGREEDPGWGGGEDRRGRNGGTRGDYYDDRRAGDGRRGDDRRVGDDRRGEERRPREPEPGSGSTGRPEEDRDRSGTFSGQERDRGGRDRNGRRLPREPEWMNECVSKSDVIELRGFDGPGKSKAAEGAAVNKVNLGSLLPNLGAAKEEAEGVLGPLGRAGPGPGLPTGGEPPHTLYFLFFWSLLP